MRILLAASEGLPYVASGGLADVAGSLSKALVDLGEDCRVVLPLYSTIPQKFRDTLEYVTSFSVPLGWRKQYCGVFKGEYNGVIYYFIDNEYYFKRDKIYGYYDDGERFAFYSRAILEMIYHLDWGPEVLHLNDWQTALSAVYLNLFYRKDWRFSNIRCVFTIHNIQYQGKYGLEISEDLFGIPFECSHIIEFDNCANLMKGAIVSCSKVSTVSETYAEEIKDPYFSYGLDPVIYRERAKVRGILNGIDTKLYDCATDPNIVKNFTSQATAGKRENKEALCNEMGMKYNPDKPLVVMVTRLVENKGIDLVKYVFDDIIANGMQFVMLGSGEKVYEDFFNEMKAKYPDDVGVYIGFNQALSKRVYAGGDIFLMPSQNEPCGLSQMIATRYATIPVVRETGGLKDSIKDFGEEGEGQCGYTFKSYNAHDMLGALLRAKGAYDNKTLWLKQMRMCLKKDFSWKNSAQKYIDLYNDAY